MNKLKNIILILILVLIWLIVGVISGVALPSKAQPAIIKQIDIIAGEDPMTREYTEQW